MKKLVLAAAFVFAGSFAFAQIDQGTIKAGGNLGFTSGSNDANDVKTSSFTFGPELGYFFADNMEAFLNIGIGSSKSELDSDNSNTNGSTNIGLGVRKYFMPSDAFGFFAGLGLGISSGSNEMVSAGVKTETETKGLDVGIHVGVVYFPTSNIGLSAKLGGLAMNTMTDVGQGGADDVKTTEIGLNLGNTVVFGFHWYFGNE